MTSIAVARGDLVAATFVVAALQGPSHECHLFVAVTLMHTHQQSSAKRLNTFLISGCSCCPGVRLSGQADVGEVNSPAARINSRPASRASRVDSCELGRSMRAADVQRSAAARTDEETAVVRCSYISSEVADRGSGQADGCMLRYAYCEPCCIVLHNERRRAAALLEWLDAIPDAIRTAAFVRNHIMCSERKERRLW